ncbi:Acg family FMN-binding oxidoreductase [Actinomadura parmotrematis]|uniref:Nitroreductase n=1 Tax=Actinomadura parmotrematis TaxID=2864039 RepID=A0ABS7FPT2_9ACTN|nr:hypothetical protein [Actinomadura parmotrematis]MBW8482414.1 hypothetical protein [Actinomadura parmotrematis]
MTRDAADAVRRAVAAAVRAPSVHNTQPWSFAVRGDTVVLRADPDRRLGAADPAGREMMISCGAALYTLRLALRREGRAATVRALPDPSRPNLVAEVDARPGGGPGAEELALYEQIERRRTHRGGFRPGPGAVPLLPVLRTAAEAEGARLVQILEARGIGMLAGLTQAADHLERRSSARAGEAARWAPSPGSGRRDGVAATAYPAEPARTEPHFPARDFAHGRGWGTPPDASGGGAELGTVLLLTTLRDEPADWLRAGQALQHVLLRAAGDGLAAAIHTQPLEVPELRGFIRVHLCAGAHPQMLLRLGAADPAADAPPSPRRPAADVTTEED